MGRTLTEPDSTVDGVDRDVFKDPVTDSGKRSKKGRLKLISNGSGYETVSLTHAGEDKLVTVFENGAITKEYSFEEVKKNANTL